jgi:hypothetical protein
MTTDCQDEKPNGIGAKRDCLDGQSFRNGKRPHDECGSQSGRRKKESKEL